MDWCVLIYLHLLSTLPFLMWLLFRQYSHFWGISGCSWLPPIFLCLFGHPNSDTIPYKTHSWAGLFLYAVLNQKIYFCSASLYLSQHILMHPNEILHCHALPIHRHQAGFFVQVPNRIGFNLTSH